jgi:hypothetical protein
MSVSLLLLIGNRVRTKEPERRTHSRVSALEQRLHLRRESWP